MEPSRQVRSSEVQLEGLEKQRQEVEAMGDACWRLRKVINHYCALFRECF